MIYTDSQLKEKIVQMIESFENEVVEFKEATFTRLIVFKSYVGNGNHFSRWI